jgi:hypothetical protein
MPSSVDGAIAKWTSAARSLIFRRRTSPDAEIISITHSPWPAAFNASRNGLIGWPRGPGFATKVPASGQRNPATLCFPRQQSRKKFHGGPSRASSGARPVKGSSPRRRFSCFRQRQAQPSGACEHGSSKCVGHRRSVRTLVQLGKDFSRATQNRVKYERLEEERSRSRRVPATVWSFQNRPVAQVNDGLRHQLVGGEDVMHSASGRIQLRDQSQEELSIELIGVAQIHDVEPSPPDRLGLGPLGRLSSRTDPRTGGS